MGYSGAGGKLIHEKNQKQKISWHCPFKDIDHLGPKYIPIICHLWDSRCFSLVPTFKQGILYEYNKLVIFNNTVDPVLLFLFEKFIKTINYNTFEH